MFRAPKIRAAPVSAIDLQISAQNLTSRGLIHMMTKGVCLARAGIQFFESTCHDLAQVLAQRPVIRGLFQEHLVAQWENGVMTSEALDRCLQMISKAETTPGGTDKKAP